MPNAREQDLNSSGFDITSHRYYPAPILKLLVFKMGADFLAPQNYRRAYICAAALLIGRIHLKVGMLKPYMQDEERSMPATVKGAISFRLLHVPHFAAHSHPG